MSHFDAKYKLEISSNSNFGFFNLVFLSEFNLTGDFTGKKAIIIKK